MESKKDTAPKSGDYDTLVLSGGSIHAMIILGALQYATDKNLLTRVTTYVGTSSGAICSYLLAVGYTPIEIMVHLCTRKILEHMKTFNIVDMVNGKGATSFSYIHEQLEIMTIAKVGRLLTMTGLRERTGNTFICATHNRTDNVTEYLGPEQTPDLPCLTALRMSSSLPFIFDNFTYMGKSYVDGGVSNNFPINIGDNFGNKVLGLVLQKIDGNFSHDHATVVESMYHLMATPIQIITKHLITGASDKCDIIRLRPDGTMFFNFNINTQVKLDMFSEGYAQIKIHYEGPIEPEIIPEPPTAEVHADTHSEVTESVEETVDVESFTEDKP